ncbi:MAG: flagellar export chaperone FliS [Rubripirellula sp.]
MNLPNHPPARWSEHVATGDHYLESAVRTASPARLRSMLIERAVEVSTSLAANWRAETDPGPNAASLKLLELINELLRGVVGGKDAGEQEIGRKVADLYVFLAKHLVVAETTSDADAIDEIRAVLEIEAETWRAVCANENSGIAESPVSGSESGGLNLEA